MPNHELSPKLTNLISSLSDTEKDELYRHLWLQHVKEDIETVIEDDALIDDEAVSDERYNEVVNAAANLYVYEGEYDCNLDYWTNIRNILSKLLSDSRENS